MTLLKYIKGIESKEEFKGVMDLVMQVLQLLRRDLQELVNMMEPVKSWDEG